MKEFDDLLRLAEHLVLVRIGLQHEKERGLERACVLIETDAREQIGHYQGAVGPFPEWAPLADSTEDEKARRGYETGAPLLREGDLQDSFAHEVKGDEAEVGSTDPVMEFHEFGTSKMPPRPVVGPALYKQQGAIEREIGRALVQGIVGGEITDSLLHLAKD